ASWSLSVKTRTPRRPRQRATERALASPPRMSTGGSGTGSERMGTITRGGIHHKGTKDTKEDKREKRSTRAGRRTPFPIFPLFFVFLCVLCAFVVNVLG